jgi:hypothetical protein
MADEIDTAKALDMIDWYRQCLQDVIARRSVRGLDEAEAGYLTAMRFLGRQAHEESVGGVR